MKKISNRKTWDDEGWLYEFRRTVGAETYAYNLRIPRMKIHYRDHVAKQLRIVRKCFHGYVNGKDAA